MLITSKVLFKLCYNMYMPDPNTHNTPPGGTNAPSPAEETIKQLVSEVTANIAGISNELRDLLINDKATEQNYKDLLNKANDIDKKDGELSKINILPTGESKKKEKQADPKTKLQNDLNVLKERIVAEIKKIQDTKKEQDKKKEEEASKKPFEYLKLMQEIGKDILKRKGEIEAKIKSAWGGDKDKKYELTDEDKAELKLELEEIKQESEEHLKKLEAFQLAQEKRQDEINEQLYEKDKDANGVDINPAQYKNKTPKNTAPEGKDKLEKKLEEIERLLGENTKEIKNFNKLKDNIDKSEASLEKINYTVYVDSLNKYVGDALKEKDAIDKEASAAWKDGEKTREKLKKEDAEELKAKYFEIWEGIDSKINEVEDKITIESGKNIQDSKLIKSLIKIKDELKKIIKSIDDKVASLSKIDYTEKFKNTESKIAEMNKKMDRARELTLKMSEMSSREIKTEGKNVAIRWLKKIGDVSTFSDQDKINYTYMAAERAAIIKSVGGFYKDSLKDLYSLGFENDSKALSDEEDKKRKSLIKNIKDIREQMYADKSNRWAMTLKNILKSPSLEVANAWKMGTIVGQRYADSVSDSFSSDPNIRKDARDTLTKGTAVIGGGLATVLSGGILTGIAGAVGGAGIAKGITAANNKYYKKSA